jgi:plasmid stabilization system protein ParE
MTGIEIKWTPFALRCLDEIHFYILYEAGSASPADRFVNQLFDRVDQLMNFPELGQVELSLSKRGLNCRYLVEGNYKIIYEHSEKSSLVIILDVFQTAQDPNKIIKR